MIFLRSKFKIGEFGQVLMRFASAQIISNLLRMLSGFLVVRAIAPELYGQFTGVGIYMGYILLGQGGVINGLSRELPYELGRGNDNYAKQMASSVFVLSLIVSFLAFLLFLGISVKYFIVGEALTGVIFLSYSLMGGLYLLNKQFLPTLYRTNKDFNSLSKQNIKVGIGNLLTVLLVWFFGIYGLIARGIILAIYEFSLLYKNKPYFIQFQYDFKDYKKLLHTGLPIFMVGQVNPLWATILNNIIFSAGGAISFGLYAISNIVQGAIGVIPSAFSSVIYPRMAIMLGEGKSIVQILKVNVKPLFFQFGVMLSVAIAGVILLPIVIPILLPQYVAGIEAAQWMVFVPAVQSFGALNNIYNVVKKQQWYFISLISGAFLGSLFILFQINQRGFYLEVFPQGLLIGKGIQQMMSLIFLMFLVRGEE